MTLRRMLGAVLAACAVGAGVIVAQGGSDGYRLRIPLAEGASGLEDGSEVQIAGLDRGRVTLRLEKGDRVVADVELDEDAGPVGRGASARVVAANFLGRKRIVVDPGDAARDPAPDGWTMPAGRVTTPTDLDQVLGVFDRDTRTRAQILLSELGEAVVGRRVDIHKLLAEFPTGMSAVSDVVRSLRTSDRTMDDLLVRSDRIVAALATERRALGRLVDTVGQTAETVSARRDRLRATLARAPGALRELRGLLADLERTTHDLGPAAVELRRAAGPVAGALREVEGFRTAAGPTLREVPKTAPALTALADRATPVLRRARPAVQQLRAAGQELVPVTDALNGSSDNIIAVLENWSRAIQFRDGLSHVFRGEASFSPDLVLSAVDRLTRGKRRTTRRGRRPAPAPAASPAPQRQTPPARDPVKDVLKRLPKLPPQVDKALEDLGDDPTVQEVKKVLEGVLGGTSPDDQQPSPLPLLDFLLGS